MTTQRPHKQPLDMNLIGDMMVLYLAIDAEFGPCELYDRIGEALEAKDMATLAKLRDYVDRMPAAVRQRLIQGTDMDTTVLDDISNADLDAMAAAAAQMRHSA